LSKEALEEDDQRLIEKLRLVEGSHLKRAAVLLFHSDPEVFFTGSSIKIGYFESNSELKYQDEVQGDLFTQVEETMELLLTKYLPAEIHYDGIQRVEDYPIPESALRETVLNAIAHKDYGSGIPIQISVYDDHLVIWNNGQLPDEWTVERLTQKHPSQPYNPDIANAFFRAGLIEAWGRGIEKVIQACNEAGISPPTLSYESNGLTVNFEFEDQVGTKLGLSPKQEEILLKSKDGLPLRDLMELSGRTNRTKFRDQVLTPLMEESLIEMTIPDKPRSPKQKYKTTRRGLAVLKKLGSSSRKASS
tara:strand:- start:40 stop:951 length:912 start_codon:yes stop_codon:yes gene_type:complete